MTGIDDKARELPWIGAPVDAGAGSDEMALPDGRGWCRDYENGSIYWTAQTGAHEVHGGIRLHWAEIGGVGALGYPVTDETGCPDGIGRFNHFELGSIYWTPDLGAHEVHGAIEDLWQQGGWELGRLGYPTSDEHDVPGGRASLFQHGQVVWTPSGGAAAHFPMDE